MIKQILCFRRKADVSALQFRDYWNTEFEQFIRSVAVKLGCRRLTKSLTLQVEENQLLQQRQQFEAPFDGVVEMWFDQPKASFEATASEEWQQMVKTLTEGKHFALDLKRSTSFYADETIIIDKA
ncbi:EthD domain-containing protein [Aestuariirhabdus sp. LZHN29]|uniref:EthD domain-containing protein n=1 Tax=Aestuariirhabdus sp. LZHN29 TaxID=3417462 RepID=UPI003CF46234